MISYPIIWLTCLVYQIEPPLVCLVSSFPRGPKHPHILPIPLAILLLDITRGMCVPGPPALSVAWYTNIIMVYIL